MVTPKLTKREHFALEIYKSLINQTPAFGRDSDIERAIKQADELIQALEDSVAK